jgi:hypothetical protein
VCSVPLLVEEKGQRIIACNATRKFICYKDKIPSWKFPLFLRRKQNISDKTKSSASGCFNHATNGSNQKSRRHKMTKHASTSNCIGKDGGSSCSRVPLLLPLPPLLCLLPSLCMLSLLSSLPLLLLSLWHCPRAAAAANNDSRKHGTPPQPPLPLLLPSMWGGGVRALWPAIDAPFDPLSPHSQGGLGSSQRWRR